MANKGMKSFNVDCALCPSRTKSVLCHLNAAELTRIDDNKTCIIYKKGQTILHENGHPLGIYSIYDGKVKIVRSGNEGKDQIVRLVKTGDIFGYRALFSNTRYNASAIALEDSRICFIPRDAFF